MRVIYLPFGSRDKGGCHGQACRATKLAVYRVLRTTSAARPGRTWTGLHARIDYSRLAPHLRGHAHGALTPSLPPLCRAGLLAPAVLAAVCRRPLNSTTERWRYRRC